MQEYLSVLKKYVVFNGRAGRREYWMFVLFSLIASFVLSIIDSILGTQSGGTGALTSLYSLAVLLPSIGVGIRRMHDTNHSGWFLLICLIPFGAFYVLYLAVQPSDAADNQYGPNPSSILPAA